MILSYMKMTEILHNNSEENLGDKLLASVLSLKISILILIYIILEYAYIFYDSNLNTF